MIQRLSILIFMLAAQLAPALTITRTSSPIFYVDTSITPSLHGMYVAYQVSNNDGINYADLWVRIDSFAGGVISLGPNEDGFAHLGPLGPGQTKTAYFYLQASGATLTPQTHTVRVYPNRAGIGQLASANFSMTSEETIQANANKVTTVITGPNPAELGGIVTMTVSGETGTVGAGRILSFSPAGYLNWRADAYELISATITVSGGNNLVLNDQLFAIAPSTADSSYAAVYTFRAVTTTLAPTAVSPIGFISSGANVKHTTTGNYINLQPILPPDNRLTVGKTAAPAEFIGAGTVTFTLILTNNGFYNATVDEFNDTLPTTPAQPTYVPGSSRYNGAVIADPIISGATLSWSGFFSVPAGASYSLTFRASIPATVGTYTNRAICRLGPTQLDTTLDTTDNFPPFATVLVRQLRISGLVYNDLNHNLQKDPGEAGTGLSLFAKLVSGGSALQAVTVTNSTGEFAFNNVLSGNYLIVIDNNNSLADVTPTIPAGWIGTEQPSQIRSNVIVTTTDVANQNFGLANVIPLRGRVFIDNGAGTAGLSGATLRLTDASGATTYDTAVSDAAGNYVLYIPATLPNGVTLRVVESNPANYISISGSPGTTGGTYNRSTDAVTFTLALGASYSGVDFGEVPPNSFVPDGQQSGLPGTFVVYPHTYTAAAAGSLLFSVANMPNPNIGGWTQVLYRDANCNAQVDATDPVLNAAINVVAGENVCILVRDFIPVAAPFNGQNQITVTAAFTYTGPAGAGLATNLSRTDLTIVGNPTTAGLTLVKTVNKATAAPGETLTYTVIYSNTSSEPLNNIVIFDSIPAYTTFLSAPVPQLPPNLTGVNVTTPAVGASGSIRWTFSGTLSPSQSAAVTFSVSVTP
jgi:uncharacterized repeat protein (TIGR01451 family)